jgi:hypothetical protein
VSKKSSLKILNRDYSVVVSTPAAVESMMVFNDSDENHRVEIIMRRGTDEFMLFTSEMPPRRRIVVFEGKDRIVNVQGSDSIEARASASDRVHIACSYRETAGSSPLFNSLSWNDRASWAESRGRPTPSLVLPGFVVRGLNEGASRWRSSCTYRRWVYEAVESILPGWRGLELQNYTQINSDNGYLAACGVNLYVNGSGVINSVSFNLQVNVFYEQELTESEWGDVMAHELGHGLGIGIFWNSSSFFLNGSSYPSVQEAYNRITSLDRSKTPLESSGGSGTASSHWENDFRLSDGVAYYGMSNELMVGAIVQGGMVLSDLSLGSLKDFGYETYRSSEGLPGLSTSSGLRPMGRHLKCGLSSSRIERMMTLLKTDEIERCGKLTLRRYIHT